MENEIAIIEHLPQTRQQAAGLLKTSPIEYWNSINPRTVKDVFDAPCIGLASIRKELGEPYLRALMVKWFNGFVDFYSTNGTMSNIQLADTISLVIEAYPHYTMYDFKLFFKRAKLGDFGEIYGRIDGQVILSWLRKYDVMRDTAAQNQSIREQERYKELAKRENNGGMYYQEYLKQKNL